MSDEPVQSPVNKKPSSFIYRGIAVEPEICGFETQEDGRIEPAYSWRAQGDGWVWFAPTAAAIRKQIDRRMDDGAAAARRA